MIDSVFFNDNYKTLMEQDLRQTIQWEQILGQSSWEDFDEEEIQIQASWFSQTNEADQDIVDVKKEQTAKVQLLDTIRYGAKNADSLYLSQNKLFVEPNQINYGHMIIKYGENEKILEINNNIKHRACFNFQQIDRITFYPESDTIGIFYKLPPEYSVNTEKIKSKKNILRIWRRIQNLPFKIQSQKEQEMKTNGLFHSYFFLKQGILFLKIKKFTASLKWMQENIKQFQINIEKQLILNNYKQLKQKYSIREFEKYFDISTACNEHKIYLKQIKFSLISLLYTCNTVGIDDVFKLAQFLHSQMKQNHTKIHALNIIAKSLVPTFVDLTIMTKKSIESIIENIRYKISLKEKFMHQHILIIEQNIIAAVFRLTPSGMLPFGWNIDVRNKLFRHYKKNDYQFIKVMIADDIQLSGQKVYTKFYKNYVQNQQKQLQNMHFLQQQYLPFAWTQSQLKNNQMWFVQHSQKKGINRGQFLGFLGSFDHINNPALRGARIGQNLSTPFSYIKPKKINLQLQKDSVSDDGYLFTDGIGKISSNLVETIQKKLRNKSTCFQIRFQGAKGMLCQNKNLQYNKIVLRESMKKFECENAEAKKSLEILEFNRYREGYLNRQIIMLLEANGIEVEIFEEILDEYLQMIKNMQQMIKEEAFKVKKREEFIEEQQQFRVQNVCQAAGIIKNKYFLNYSAEPILRGVITQRYRQLIQDIISKSRIKVQKSARLLGIIDEYEILKQDQIYCTIERLQKYSKQIRQNLTGRVMITRNPCRHPADIRVVRCVSDEEILQRFKKKEKFHNYFLDFSNAIVFPKTGKIPLTAQISGSDLDGDMFFICWDQRLIPKESHEPYIVDSTKGKQRIWQQINKDKKMINFFVQFCHNDSLGRIANSHMAKVDQEGPLSSNSLKLCQAFYQSIDYAKKGCLINIDPKLQPWVYPHYMQSKTKKTYISTTALGRLYDISKEFEKFYLIEDCDKTLTANIIPQFIQDMKKYPKQQIQRAFKVAKEFQSDIEAIIELKKLQNESQVYILSNKQQNQSQNRYFMNLQIKYFELFFQAMPMLTKPQDYYQSIRQRPGYNFCGNISILNERIKQRIMLWYHIAYLNLFLDCDKKKQWKSLLQNHQKQLKIQISDISKYHGLLWFAVPCLFYIFLGENNLYRCSLNQIENNNEQKRFSKKVKPRDSQQIKQTKQKLQEDIKKRKKEIVKLQRKKKCLQNQQEHIEFTLLEQILLEYFNNNKQLRDQKYEIPDQFKQRQVQYQKCMQYLLKKQVIEMIIQAFEQKQNNLIPGIKGQFVVPIEINEIDNNFRLIHGTFKPNGEDSFQLDRLLLSGQKIGIATNNRTIGGLNFSLCFLKKDFCKNKTIFKSSNRNIKQYTYFIDLEQIIASQRQFQAIQNIRHSELYKKILLPLKGQVNRIIANHQKKQIIQKDKNGVLQQIKKVRNPSQIKAIKEITARDYGIYLIQGPPGTGKTSTIFGLIALQHEIILQTITEKQIIHVCSHSNASINDICRKIVAEGLFGKEVKQTEIIRIGKVDKNSKDLLRYNLKYQIQKQFIKEQWVPFSKTKVQLEIQLQQLIWEIKGTEKTKELTRKLNQLTADLVQFTAIMLQNKDLIDQIRINKLKGKWLILSTLNASGAPKIRQFLENKVSCLIVDEACQATETSILIPLQSKVQKLILVGDPKQLPASVKSPDAYRSKFNRSMFERFVDAGIKPFFLNIQYRMKPELMIFSNKLFYQARLMSGQQQVSPIPLKSSQFFYDLSYSQEQKSGKSYINLQEAWIVSQISSSLAQKYPQLTIGIITPYGAQNNIVMYRLKKTLSKTNKIKVSTVDSFQGQQRDIIILTCVRSNNFNYFNKNSAIGFLKDEKRLNVALTRAKYLLIVVGNKKTLSCDYVWKQYIKFHQENKTYYEIRSRTFAEAIMKNTLDIA